MLAGFGVETTAPPFVHLTDLEHGDVDVFRQQTQQMQQIKEQKAGTDLDHDDVDGERQRKQEGVVDGEHIEADANAGYKVEDLQRNSGRR